MLLALGCWVFKDGLHKIVDYATLDGEPCYQFDNGLLWPCRMVQYLHPLGVS